MPEWSWLVGRPMPLDQLKRREFVTLIGGAMAWPIAAHAQQPERLRRIGVLMLYPENDPQGQVRATAFREGLQKLGWVVGRNIQIDFQWGLGNADWIRSAAAQLLESAPDVILANGTPAARIMQQSSRTVPIIFIAGSDPVLDGLVPSLAHPGGNLTGFYVFEPSLGAKLLELLKEMHRTSFASPSCPTPMPIRLVGWMLRLLRPRGSRSNWWPPHCAMLMKSKSRWHSGEASRISD